MTSFETNKGFLRARGRMIVDGNGQEIQLRGVGLGNWLLPEGYMWHFPKQMDRPRRIEQLVKELLGPESADRFWNEFRKYYIAEPDIQRIAELGFNSVRPAVNSRILMDEENGELLPEGFKLLDQLLDWCGKYGLYCFIDLHGAPGGQTGKNIDDSAADTPELFRQAKYQDWTVKLWVEIARRYKDNPVVGGYDLLNEPLPNDFKNDAPLLEPFYKRLTNEIRKVDARHLIILEGAHWATDFSVFGRPFQENLCYQFHKYWNEPDQGSIQKYLGYSEKWNVPLWLGETGENDNNWFWAAFQMCDDLKVGWSFWPWKKMDTNNTPYSILPPEGWDKIQDYAAGEGGVAQEEAERIFRQLLNNLRLENCEYRPEVINALFRRVPARIQAENFGYRGQGVSFKVQDSEFKSSLYRRNEGIRIEPLTEDYYVGWTEAGEWLAYDVDCDSSSEFDLYFKMACPYENKFFHLDIDGQNVTGSLEIPKTGTWTKWIIFAKKRIFISKGRHQLRLVCETDGFNVDWFSVNPRGAIHPSDRVENEKMMIGGIGKIPGKIKAEQFGNRGLDGSYHVKDPHQNQGVFRLGEGVGIGAVVTSYCIQLKQGEWTSYEINVDQSQPLKLKPGLRAQGFGVPAELELRIDGKVLPGQWQFPAENWKVFTGKPLELSRGRHQLELLVVKGCARVDWVEFQ